ncbi:MAG: ATP-binding protein [Dysgonamonadaceae bacterium]|jgi:AAA+ ATPase superfamily predicted ATPase|nr:ATP-binding protein [Dysgonamonadaceae bacterium]
MDTTNIIGRGTEIQQLETILNSGKAEFLVVYGRRRIGKTFLIKQFFKGKFAFYLSGAENASKEAQLFNFAIALREYSGKEYPLVDSWQKAFVQLKEYLQNIKKKGRKVIFIDEMPWLDNAKSGFLSAFEYWWNTYASSNNEIVLVVCGSSTSWITKKIFKNRGGLHNRVTRQIALQPFTLAETEQFLKAKKTKMSRLQIAECYMIMGGVPYYLEQLEKHYSLEQNIDNLFFKKNGILRDEFSKIYSSLFKSPEKYMQVIEVLSQKRKGLLREEIVKLTKIPDGGGLTSILEELELCGFISINNNFSTPKSNKLFQLTDFYSLFYTHFIKNRNITDKNFWSNTINTPLHNAWTGFAFELLCLAHIEQIRRKLGIGGVITCTFSWRSKKAESDNVQIDLLIDRADNVINICEMKFSRKEFTISKTDDENIRNKVWTFAEETRTKKALHTTLITTFGVKHNAYWNEVQSEVRLEDLFI